MGKILDRPWAAKQRAAASVSNRAIDGICEVAKKNGAMAGRR